MRKTKIKNSGTRSWSENEVKLLKKLYQDKSVRNIADKLGRSLKAVKSKASAIGLTREGPRFWSNQEMARLKKLHSNKTNKDIAKQLGRSVWAVAAKAHKLGLTEKPRVWSKKELNLLKRLYPSKTAEEIAGQMGRAVPATRLRIVKLGLKKRLRYEECHRIANGLKQKLCRTCRRWKSESEFYKDRSQKDGLLGRCKKCSSKAAKKSRKKKLGRS